MRTRWSSKVYVFHHVKFEANYVSVKTDFVFWTGFISLLSLLNVFIDKIISAFPNDLWIQKQE